MYVLTYEGEQQVKPLSRPENRGRKTRISTNTNPYNSHYLYIYKLFVNASNKNKVGCQANVMATSLG